MASELWKAFEKIPIRPNAGQRQNKNGVAVVQSNYSGTKKTFRQELCITNPEDREFLSRRSATIRSGVFRRSGNSYCQPRLWVFRISTCFAFKM